MGEEAVLADSVRVREIAARVGRVRSLAFLNSLRLLLNESVNIRALRFCHAQVVCQYPARRNVRKDDGEGDTAVAPDEILP